MALVGLLSLPVEVTCLILQDCDSFADLFAAVTTCRRLFAVFEANTGSIARPIGLRRFVAWDMAILAMRITKLAVDAYRADTMLRPQDMYPLEQLSGANRPPSLPEFRELFPLQHFCRCVEHLMLVKTTMPAFVGNVPADKTVLEAVVGHWPRNDPDFPAMHRAWKERLHTTIYRLVIAGAALSMAYNEPFIRADRIPDFLERCTDESAPQPGSYYSLLRTGAQHACIKPEDLRYLRQFPVYRTYKQFTPYDVDEETAFVGLAGWLARDMRRLADAENETLPHGGGFMGPWPITLQIMQTVHVVDLLNTLITQAGGQRGSLRTPYTPIMRPCRQGPQGKTRKVTVVLHGVWRPEEITMPARPGDEMWLGAGFARTHLFAELAATGPDMGRGCPSYHKTINLAVLLKDLSQIRFDGSLQAWWTDPEYRLFHFMLRAHAGIDCAEEFFLQHTAQWVHFVTILSFRLPFYSNLFSHMIASYNPTETADAADVLDGPS
ncbi:hypothetical protein B0T26DRAFT_710782, partial [Lasiosphaeria miniovina]